MSSSRLVIEDYVDVTVAKFQDSSILEMRLIDELGQELYNLPEVQGKKKIILDFSNVKFLASHTLGVLLNLSKKCKAVNGQMVMCGIRKELMKLFTITSLDKMFKFFPDDKAALAHFGIRVSD